MAQSTSGKDGNGFQLRVNIVTVGSPNSGNRTIQVRHRGWVVSTYASSIARGTGKGVLDGSTTATLKDQTRTVPLNGTLLLFDVTRTISYGNNTTRTITGSVNYGTVNSGTPWGITRRTQSVKLALPYLALPPPPPDPDPTDAWIQLFADAYIVSQDGNVGYFDGDSPGAEWAGTPNASITNKPNPNDVPFYDALVDDNRILSATAGTPETYIIDSGYYAKEIFQPIPTDVYPCPAGTYYISDADHLPIVPAQWESYGGSVYVDINELGQLEVTITPPTTEIPGTTGTYYLAASQGQDRFAQLKVNGVGVVTKPVQLTLPTGADWSKINTEIAQSLNIPWITTRLDAYTAANRMNYKASGAAPALRFTISLNEVASLGISAGSVIRFKDSMYRVVSLSMATGGVSLTLNPYTRVEEFDEVWDGYTVGDFDEFWEDRTVRDFNQKPLRNPNGN